MTSALDFSTQQYSVRKYFTSRRVSPWWPIYFLIALGLVCYPLKWMAYQRSLKLASLSKNCFGLMSKSEKKIEKKMKSTLLIRRHWQEWTIFFFCRHVRKTTTKITISLKEIAILIVFKWHLCPDVISHLIVRCRHSIIAEEKQY